MDYVEVREAFLATIESWNFRRNTRWHLRELEDFLRAQETDPLAAEEGDILRFYNQYVESKEVSKIFKRRYLYAINNLNKFLKRHSLATTGTVTSLHLPDPDLVVFTEHTKDPDLEALLNEQNFFTEQEVEAILLYARLNFQPKWFWTTFLLATSGPRVSEVVSLKRKFVVPNERFYISGLVKGFAKKGLVIHFFQDVAVRPLQSFLNKINIVYPMQKFVFIPLRVTHTRNAPGAGEFVSATQVRYRLYEAMREVGLELKIGKGVVTKGFRDTINTLRKERFQLDSETRSKIFQHKVPGVNATNYLKRLNDIRTLRDLWDRYNPYAAFVRFLFTASRPQLERHLEELKRKLAKIKQK